MAQTLFTTLVNVGYLSGGGNTPATTKIQNLIVNVTDKSSGNYVPVTNLTGLNFQITLNGNVINMINNWTLSATPQAGNYQINFVPGSEPNGNDYLIIVVQLPNSNTFSNRLFVDCAVEFNDNGTGTITNYNITTPGKYQFVLNNIDGTMVNIPSQYSYTFVNAPSAMNSSITPTTLTPGVVYALPAGGMNVPLQIVLKDTNNQPISGDNQVSVYASLQ